MQNKMNVIKRIIFHSIILFVVVLTAGCTNKNKNRATGDIYYSNVVDIPGQSLAENQSVVMDWYVDSPQTEANTHNSHEYYHTLHKYTQGQQSNLWLIVGWNPRYINYSGIVAEIKTVAPDNSFWSDTVAIDFLNNENQIMQKMNNNHNTMVMFRQNASFSKQGKWSFSIRQLNNSCMVEKQNREISQISATNNTADSNTMPDTLKGITAIGIEIRSY